MCWNCGGTLGAYWEGISGYWNFVLLPGIGLSLRSLAWDLVGAALAGLRADYSVRCWLGFRRAAEAYETGYQILLFHNHSSPPTIISSSPHTPTSL
jgi:hypothetical protein